MNSRYGIVDEYDDSIILVPFLIYLSIAGCVYAVAYMVANGTINLEDYLNSKMQELFTLDTVIEVLAFFGVFNYRVVIAKLLFNTLSFVYNLLIFIPLTFLKLVFYSIQSMIVVILTIIANSWGFNAEFSEFWPDRGSTKNKFLKLFKRFNGTNETEIQNNNGAE